MSCMLSPKILIGAHEDISIGTIPKNIFIIEFKNCNENYVSILFTILYISYLFYQKRRTVF